MCGGAQQGGELAAGFRFHGSHPHMTLLTELLTRTGRPESLGFIF